MNCVKGFVIALKLGAGRSLGRICKKHFFDSLEVLWIKICQKTRIIFDKFEITKKIGKKLISPKPLPFLPVDRFYMIFSITMGYLVYKV